jgi:hypothetical protein
MSIPESELTISWAQAMKGFTEQYAKRQPRESLREINPQPQMIHCTDEGQTKEISSCTDDGDWGDKGALLRWILLCICMILTGIAMLQQRPMVVTTAVCEVVPAVMRDSPTSISHSIAEQSALLEQLRAQTDDMYAQAESLLLAMGEQRQLLNTYEHMLFEVPRTEVRTHVETAVMIRNTTIEEPDTGAEDHNLPSRAPLTDDNSGV